MRNSFRRVVAIRISIVSPSLVAALYTGYPLAVISAIAAVALSLAGRVGLALVAALWSIAYVYIRLAEALLVVFLSLQVFAGVIAYSRARPLSLARHIAVPSVMGVLASIYLYLAYWRIPLDIGELAILSSNGGMGIILGMLALFTYNISYRLASPRTFRLESEALRRVGKSILPATVYLLTIIPVFVAGEVVFSLILAYIASKLTEMVGARRFSLVSYMAVYYITIRFFGIEEVVNEFLMNIGV